MLPKDKGLSTSEAEEKLKEVGPNKLPEKAPPSSLIIFISQLKSPLVYVLVGAGIITFLLKDYSDAAIIFFAVFVNTILGFFQEKRASKAIFALKELIHPEAQIIRDGERISLPIEKIVPGDVAFLSAGTKIPADGEILEASRFFTSEAILTGEASAVSKKPKAKVFMGTVATAGTAYFKVEKTGSETEIGKIAQRVQEKDEDTPLREQLKKLSKSLSLLVFILTVIVFAIGILVGRDFIEIFTTSVALAVSAIPEGLLVGLTVVLAIGMQKIARRKGLVRNLVSAETLGGVSTICVDKTGTLTKGQMQVVETIGSTEELSLQASVANDLDDPLVIAAYDWATKKGQIKSNREKYKRLESIPFSSKERFFASLNQWNESNNMIFVNGAPEFLLNWSILAKSKKNEIEKEVERLALEGKRVVGFARKKVTKSKKRLEVRDVKSGLNFVGLLAFSDPVRSGVKEALVKTKKAGIEMIVITGDYGETAISVMERLGEDVKSEEVILGSELSAMGKYGLSKRLKEGPAVKLFARTTPEQKLEIVEALKENNRTVAMMGDGVNDAPALKKSDIGIVVGGATDVAKETADLILLDSSFATIVEAIEEGRGIYDNIRKIILYLMSDAFEEIIAVVGTLLLGLPLPVTAGQVLWINLISDGFPDLALTVDPKAKGIMERSPRPTWEPLFTRWMKMLVGIISLAGGLISLSLFIYFLKKTGDVSLARSVAFASLGVNSLVFVFSVRTLTSPFWNENPLENNWLNIAVVGGLVLQFLPFFLPSLRNLFGLEFPGTMPLLIVFLGSAVVFSIIEILKGVVRRHLEWFQH